MTLPADARGWGKLRRHTPARIGLVRAGVSVGTAAQLAFQLAHAGARDAVHAPFAADALVAGLHARGFAPLRLRSQAEDRAAYLTRPDLGRRLAADSRNLLKAGPVCDVASGACDVASGACDVAFIVADGLSARAVERHALPLLDAVTPLLGGWTIGPVAVVDHGRVAIGDEIGEALGAAAVAVLIGERPGLSSPDSLGVYLTWSPRLGRTDAERNCISNIRPEGLGYDAAARTLAFLLTEARRRKLSGVMLKADGILALPF